MMAPLAPAGMSANTVTGRGTEIEGKTNAMQCTRQCHERLLAALAMLAISGITYYGIVCIIADVTR
jgi:hypothetical protein